MYQPNSTCESGLNPDLNKPLYRKFGGGVGNEKILNTNWIWDNINKLLLIFKKWSIVI